VQDKGGRFVLPSIDSVKAAAAQKPKVSPRDFSIVNEPGSNSYPIAGYSWALLYRHYPSADKQRALCRLFQWLETKGQAIAPDINYVDLPANVSTTALATLGTCP
jgi:phosphate transport system substrate-binding protein